MNIPLIKIAGSRTNTRESIYESTVMEKGGSTPWRNSFESRYELLSIMDEILSRQRQNTGFGSLLTNVQKGGEHYFFDLDLIKEQAKALGWSRTCEVGPFVDGQ